LSVFLGVFTYAIILAVAIHPLYEKLARLLGGKRKLAAFIYALLLIGIVALPFVYLINELAGLIQGSQVYIADAKANGLPPLPDWIVGLPVVGKNISSSWQKLQMILPPFNYMNRDKSVLTRLLGGGLGVVGAGFELILGIIISAVFLNSGTKMLNPIYVVMKRMVGEMMVLHWLMLPAEL
jgi:predicted PurR-regulated permease PerM